MTMKKPAVDYSQLRLSTVREPRYRHVLLLLGWVGYFTLYMLTENLIPASACHPMHCALDDLIPFNEFFVLFYVGWYALCFASLGYYFFNDVQNFSRLQIYIMITQAVAMTCYILYPTRQDLRPEVFPRENVLTALMAFIYSFDTSTGVCPSLHVGYSMGILSVIWKDQKAKPLIKGLVLAFVLGVCAAVCFVKQHSAVDVVAALPMCLLAEILVFGKSYWLPRLQRPQGAPGRSQAARVQ